MVLLAIDYGDVRTGLAVCDKNEILATPAGCIKETYQPKLVKMLLNRAKEIGAQGFVLGNPINMDGSFGYRAEACRALAKILEEESGLPVHLVDERLTTVSAHKMLSFNGVSSEKRKDTVDELSAAIILQSYLDKKSPE